MKQLRKFRLNYFSAGTLTATLAFIFCSLTWKITAARASVKYFYSILTSQQDTIKPRLRDDSIHVKKDSSNDSTSARLMNDTLPATRVDTFAFKVSKDSLDA